MLKNICVILCCCFLFSSTAHSEQIDGQAYLDVQLQKYANNQVLKLVNERSTAKGLPPCDLIMTHVGQYYPPHFISYTLDFYEPVHFEVGRMAMLQVLNRLILELQHCREIDPDSFPKYMKIKVGGFTTFLPDENATKYGFQPHDEHGYSYGAFDATADPKDSVIWYNDRTVLYWYVKNTDY